jgi:hypothetical protein
VTKTTLAIVVGLQILVIAGLVATFPLWSNGAAAARSSGERTRLRAAETSDPRPLRIAVCTGSLDSTTDQGPWVIPLADCDKATDEIEIKSAFLSKWNICGGADSFQISLKPRSVTVTGTAFNRSWRKSEVTVAYIGYGAK